MPIRCYSMVAICTITLGACAAPDNNAEVAPSQPAANPPSSGTIASHPTTTGTTTSNPNITSAPNPNSFVAVQLTAYARTSDGELFDYPATGANVVVVPWVPGPNNANCNIACNTNTASDGVFKSPAGGYIVGMVGVSGLYAGNRCLPEDANTTPLRSLPAYNGLCASRFPQQCAGSVCWAHGGTGNMFDSTFGDANQVGLAIGSNDYLGTPGCYVRCLLNTTQLVGFIRVPGTYEANVCHPTGGGSLTATYTGQCSTDFPTCAGNVCTVDGDLTATINSDGTYNPISLGGAQCFVHTYGQVRGEFAVPGAGTVCIPSDVGNIDISASQLYKTRCANVYTGCDNNQCWSGGQ